MSIYDPSAWNLDDVVETTVIPDGTEIEARIISVKVGVRKNGVEYYNIRFDFPSEPYARDMTDFLDLPTSSLSPKVLNAVRNKMSTFFDAFGIDRTTPFDPAEDFPGLTGFVIVGVKTSEEYGDQNTVRKYVRGR